MSTAYYRNFKMQSLAYFLLTDIAHLCATSAFGTQRTFTYKECGRTPPGNNSYSIILSNDVASNVVVVISIAFFAKGFGNNG